MASVQAWRIKKHSVSKFEEFLRTSSVGHLAVVLIKKDCVYTKCQITEWIFNFPTRPCTKSAQKR